MQENEVSCSRPTTKVAAEETTSISPEPIKEAVRMIKVGAPAPDFTAPAFHQGAFTEVTMSDYLAQGKWVYICFYPGDFTFV